MRVLTVALCFSGLQLTVAATAQSAPDRANQYGYRCADPNLTHKSRDRAYLFGDSLTDLGRPALARLRPGWYVEGVRARRTACLIHQVRGLLKVDPAPRLVVVALGTNASARRDYDTVYRNAATMLPDSTRILLVTPYRHPSWNRRASGPRQKAFHTVRYARAMEALARERPRTCLAPWRRTASQRPNLLSDGTHTTRRGRNIWAKVITRAASRCTEDVRLTPLPG